MLSALCFLSVAQASVSGVVGDGLGIDVPGAMVTARHQTVSVSSVTVKADPTGHYTLNLTAPGVYLLEAEAEGYRPPPRTRDFERRTVRVLPDQKQDLRVDIRLVRPGSIRGKLVLRPSPGRQEEEVAASGVRLRLFEIRYVRGQQTPVPVQEVPIATSLSDGAFHFPGVPPGDYALEILPTHAEFIRTTPAGASKPAMGVYRAQWPDLAAPLVLRSAGQLDAGKIYLDHGPFQRVSAALEFDPCEGHLLVTWGQRLGKLNLQHARQMVPCGQTVTIDHASPGDYILTASLPSKSTAEYRYVHLPVQVTAAEPVSIRQQARNLALVNGRIHVPEGVSVDWTAIKVRMFPVLGAASLAEATPVPVDAKGKFQIPARASWTYSLSIDALPANLALSHIEHNGVRLQSRIVAFGDAAAHDSLALHLSANLATVNGAALGEDAKPVEGATILLAPWPAVFSDGFPISLRTESSEDGSFTFKQVPAGAYRAVALPGGAGIDDASSASILSLFAAGTAVEVRDSQAASVRLRLKQVGF